MHEGHQLRLHGSLMLAHAKRTRSHDGFELSPNRQDHTLVLQFKFSVDRKEHPESLQLAVFSLKRKDFHSRADQYHFELQVSENIR